MSRRKAHLEQTASYFVTSIVPIHVPAVLKFDFSESIWNELDHGLETSMSCLLQFPELS
jgi:hypothetical protein